jgi:hypothetical protein
MPNILLIKTSSLGDVVHNLPVVSDIRARFPRARIDWVVEEAYRDIVGMHPGVHRAIPVALRRWRGNMLRSAHWREFGQFRRLPRTGCGSKRERRRSGTRYASCIKSCAPSAGLMAVTERCGMRV